MRGAYTAVDWCNAVMAHDMDYLRILASSHAARRHINDECIVGDERFRPIEYAVNVRADVARVRLLLECGAHPNESALMRLYGADPWPDYKEEVGNLLHQYGAQHNLFTFTLYLLRQQTHEAKIAAFVKHPEWIRSPVLEEKYIHYQRTAAHRLSAARSAATTLMGVQRRKGAGFVSKDAMRLIGKCLVSPAYASSPEWKRPPLRQILWKEKWKVVAVICTVLTLVIVCMSLVMGHSEHEQRIRDFDRKWAEMIAKGEQGKGTGTIIIGSAATATTYNSIAIGSSAVVAASRPQQATNPGGCPSNFGGSIPCNLECAVSQFPPAPAYNVDTGKIYPPHQLGVWLHATQTHHVECGVTHIHLDRHHYGKWDLRDTVERIIKYACPNRGWRFSIPAEEVMFETDKQTMWWRCLERHDCVVFWDERSTCMKNATRN